MKDFTLHMSAEDAKILLTAMQDFQRDLDADSVDPYELLRLYKLRDTQVIEVLGQMMGELWIALVDQADADGLPRPKPPWYDLELL